jgi:hypothetical protein
MRLKWCGERGRDILQRQAAMILAAIILAMWIGLTIIAGLFVGRAIEAAWEKIEGDNDD